MSSDKNKPLNPPIAESIPHEMLSHGDSRIDPYYWLREKESEKTLRYLREENAYREEMMRDSEAFQEQLFREIKGRLKEDDQSVPYFKNGYWYYVRYNQGQEYPLYCRKAETLEHPEEILLDVNQLAEGHDYYQVGGMSVSPNNEWIAFGVDTLSRRIYRIHFKHLPSGKILDYQLEQSTGSSSWSADGKHLFYTVKDSSLRAHKIYRHQLHQSPSEDLEVYHESDPTFVCSVYKSKSEDFLIIASHSTVSNEYRFLPSDQAEGEWQVIQPRERHLEYGVAHFGEHWYIRTNADGALNFKLMRAPLAKPGREHWEEVIPHRDSVYLEGIEIFRDYLVLEERENGLSRLRVKSWDDSKDLYLPFDSETYTAGIGINPDFDSHQLRYSYSSLTKPASVIEYDMRNGSEKILKQSEVVGGYEESQYESERIWAPAPDGQLIPISLVYRKDLRRPEGNPLLLYGYGSYGYTIEAQFSSVRLSLLDRGFVYAIAHIRGGQYLGRSWYEDGKLLRKKNSFTDFIACAEHLVDQAYAASDQVYAMGGSAGGLLMGAVINMRPELFRGVIAAVPFVDVVTTMLDETIPLTTGEFDEWGNPADEEYYHYMKSYSPYDQVKAQAYPALLITAGLHDSQVQYWEPAKWCARLRALKTNEAPLYLYTNMETGHSGASGRFESLRETALEYAFLLGLAGIDH